MILQNKKDKEAEQAKSNYSCFESYQDGYNHAYEMLKDQFKEEKQKIAERIMFIISPIQFWDDTAYTLKIRNLYDYLVNELGYEEQSEKR